MSGRTAGIAPFGFFQMRRLLFIIVLAFFGRMLPAGGANVVREARQVIRNARYEENGDEARKVTERLNTAEKNLLDALAKEERPLKKAEMYYMAALVQCRFNDIENEKVYLKRAYDTTLYYNSIYNAYRYLAKCDSAEHSMGEGGKRKFRPKVRKRLLEHRPNLLNAGRFYLRKRNYEEAHRFLGLYLSSAGYPLLREDFLAQNDSMYARVAYWMVAVGYHIGAYGDVIRYMPEAMRFHRNRNYVEEYLCLSYLALNDTAAWLHELQRGLLNFPDHVYFFTSLQEYLARKGCYDDALSFAELMIRYDPKNKVFWHAKALACMRKGDYGGCVESCDVALTLDSMDIEANFFKGLAYCRMAKKASDAMKQADLRSAAYQRYKMDMVGYYARAEKPLERVRGLSPDKADRWGPLLYQVYLHQNKGREFEEIERLLEQTKESGKP